MTLKAFVNTHGQYQNQALLGHGLEPGSQGAGRGKAGPRSWRGPRFSDSLTGVDPASSSLDTHRACKAHLLGPLFPVQVQGTPLRESLPATSHPQPKQGCDLDPPLLMLEQRAPEDQPGHARGTRKMTSIATDAAEHTGSCAHTQTLVHTLRHLCTL